MRVEWIAIVLNGGRRGGSQIDDLIGRAAEIDDRLQAGVINRSKVAHHDAAGTRTREVVSDRPLISADDFQRVTGGNRRSAALKAEAAGRNGIYVARQIDLQRVCIRRALDGQAAQRRERYGDRRNQPAAGNFEIGAVALQGIDARGADGWQIERGNERVVVGDDAVGNDLVKIPWMNFTAAAAVIL